ncbi:transcriptional regulator [Marinobacterium zhoushanense]|uniref:Transcriptional regulator n=1 Tax=Marinobacterium zhoushanense TaxID=1679163 RepID=A0ABQ1KMW3_9GAMM|nr:Lrp/AsnC family transcriptional regulator [Marinobacterium zhoushanense]GGC04901.1 transcriptional regulator [Marinobacterium zhoushanense]
MDKFDQQILALLRNDARIPTSQIAREVNLSRTAVSERIRHLEQQGIIQGYHARVATHDRPAVHAFLELVYRNSRCEEYVAQIRTIPEVKRCCGISGETDMLVYVETATMERLLEIRALIENLPKMVRVKTHIILKEWQM